MKHSLVCISAGMLKPKKADTPLARLHQYLNYGLLGLATILSDIGYPVSVFHGGFLNPHDLTGRLLAENRFDTPLPLLLSLPSSFAIPWAREFSAAVKTYMPKVRIIVGGRWVTANDGAWIRGQIPAADLVVYGLAETRIEQLINPELWPTIPLTDAYVIGRSFAQDIIPPHLDFTLIDKFAEFQPCVEVSRGCGMGCNFCAEAAVPLSALRPPTAVAEELSRTAAVYAGEIRPYFQASFFRPTSRWIEELQSDFHHRGIAISWRAESRVDGLAPNQIASLASAGLKVLDLGLESASPLQLRRMEKTSNPDAYLRRAAALLIACAENGIWTKVNILLFPGETQETLRETTEWLDAHRRMIKGLSVGPMIVFRYGDESREYLQKIRKFGASAVCESDLDTLGYAHLNLSAELSHAAAAEYGRQLSREFMTADDYFDLKSFSYFPRSLSRREFDDIVSSSDEYSLPFAL